MRGHNQHSRTLKFISFCPTLVEIYLHFCLECPLLVTVSTLCSISLQRILSYMDKNNKLSLLPQHEMQATVHLNSRWQTHNEGCNWNNILGLQRTSRSGIPAAIRPFSQIISKRQENQNKTRGKEHNFTEQWLLMGHFCSRLQSTWRWALFSP